MYDIDYKNVKKGVSVYLIFLIVGIFLLVLFGYITFKNILKKSSLDSTTEATKIVENCYYDDDNDWMCSPIYYYVVDEVEYLCKTSGSSSLAVKESKNKVYYSSNNPSDCLNEYETDSSFLIYIIFIIPVIFIVVAVVNIIKIKKRINKIKYLAQHGTLYKGLRYRLESTGMQLNHRNILVPVIDFTLPTGSTIQLKGDARYDGKMSDSDGLVDLLIDLNDTENYFIDFEINYKL